MRCSYRTFVSCFSKYAGPAGMTITYGICLSDPYGWGIGFSFIQIHHSELPRNAVTKLWTGVNHPIMEFFKTHYSNQWIIYVEIFIVAKEKDANNCIKVGSVIVDWYEELTLYKIASLKCGKNNLCGMPKVSFAIQYKISPWYTEKCTFYWQVKILTITLKSSYAFFKWRAQAMPLFVTWCNQINSENSVCVWICIHTHTYIYIQYIYIYT